jgi:hypothetical protein
MNTTTEDAAPVHLRLLGNLIEYAIDRGFTLQQLEEAIDHLKLPMDDHARNVVAHTWLPSPKALGARHQVSAETVVAVRASVLGPEAA